MLPSVGGEEGEALPASGAPAEAFLLSADAAERPASTAAPDGVEAAAAGSRGPKVKGSMDVKRLTSCTDAGGRGGVGE